jgi:hypothetical protein
MGAPDRELAIQIARAETRYLMDILWIHDTNVLAPNPPDQVREVYVDWRARIDELADILAGTFAQRNTESGEQYRMALTLRALVLALGFT